MNDDMRKIRLAQDKKALVAARRAHLGAKRVYHKIGDIA